MRQEKKREEGRVIEALPNTLFRVKTNSGKEILAHLSGKMRLSFIRVLAGDRVILEISPDGERGRIVYRKK